MGKPRSNFNESEKPAKKRIYILHFTLYKILENVIYGDQKQKEKKKSLGTMGGKRKDEILSLQRGMSNFLGGMMDVHCLYKSGGFTCVYIHQNLSNCIF